MSETVEDEPATAQSTTRQRTYEWESLDPTLAALPVTRGLDLLNAIASGGLPQPPFAATLGLLAVEAEVGRVVFTLVPAEYHLNPLGTVHGGVLATMLDTSAACALHTTLPAGTGYTSMDLSVKFLRAVTVETGELRCEGTVVSAGRRTALTEAKIFDGQGRLVAHGTSSCLILDLAGG
jgi:uncharacterized protein (TIGR00369 family)